ncbi:hypothetical protein PMUG01_API004500 (apicoplast) [Plasmodium malariae]|uniref:Uncharacterized protein n=1 Tax=Plasmodium malariae TaxID=5858 RepID=A0A1D3JK84_PLAMA|nr:hypothetical protein PMUG01_API004500 [Plasmodium malariae]SBT86809.1 hypothetical protein PMUG01_API004500 [Plasmodium malariae]
MKKYILELNWYINKYKKLFKYNKIKKKNKIFIILYKKYILIIKKLIYLNII